MKTKAESMIFGLIIVYLTCYFMQLFKFPNFLMLVLGAFFCLVLLLKQKKLRIDLGVCLLAITMFSYCIVVFGIRAIVIMMPYIPLVSYVLGNYISCDIKNQEESEIRLIYVIYSLVLGHAVHGILNAYMYFAGTGWEGTRYWLDIWTRQMTPGTQLTMYFIPVFALLFPAIIFFFRRKWANVVVILGTLFFIYVSLATRTRTTVLVLALVFCGQVVLYGFLERKKVLKSVTPKKAGIFLVCIAAVTAILTFVLKDVDMIQNFILNLSKGGGIVNNVRFEAQAQALRQLFDYPMGGYQMELGRKLAHNAWLDIANAAGLIPFFAFAAYTVLTFWELVCFIRRKEIDTEVKLMIAGLYVAFFLYYTVEPALNASVHFIAPWVLLNGLVHGQLSDRGIRLPLMKK